MPTKVSAAQPSPLLSERRSRLLLAAALVLLTLLVYVPAMDGDFLWDDNWLVTENPHLGSFKGLVRMWTVDWWGDKTVPDYFPVTLTSFWLEWPLWGDKPAGYHVTNILLHAVSAVLLWRVLARLGVRWAWLAGALFAVHPVNATSVVWIAERKNTLSMVFYLLALNCYLRFDERAGWRWYFAALGLFLLALLSKTSVVMLPVVLLLTAWWRRDKVTWRDLLKSAPFLVLSIALSIVGILYQTYAVIQDSPVRQANEGFFFRLAVAGMAPWFYMLKMVFPYPLAMVYPRWSIDPKGLPYYLPGLALVGLLALTLWLRRWRPVSLAKVIAVVVAVGIALGLVQGSYRMDPFLKSCWPYLLLGLGLVGLVAGLWRWKVGCRGMLAALAYFVVTLFPVMGFFTMYYHLYSFVADHWQYVSMIGLLALAAGGAEFLARRVPRGVVPVAAVIVVGVLSVLTWHRSEVCADRYQLWKANIATYPDHFLPYYNLGRVQDEEGRYDDALKNYEKSRQLNEHFDRPYTNIGSILFKRGDILAAARYFDQALRVYPDSVPARANLGVVLHVLGRTEEGLHQLRRAERVNEHSLLVQVNMTTLLMDMGRVDEAVQHARKAVEVDPSNYQPRIQLARCLAHQGQRQEAIEQATIAVALKPDSIEAHMVLGLQLQAVGRSAEAAEHYGTVLQLQPDHVDAMNNLGAILAQRGELHGALECFSRALNVQRDNPDILVNLAFVLVRLDRPAEAVAIYRRALAIRPNWPEVLTSLGWVLAHCPDPAIRNPAEAVGLITRACELTNYSRADIVEALAAAQDAAGRRKDAIQTATRAMELAQAAGNAAQAEAIARRIQAWSSPKEASQPGGQ